MKWHLLLVPTVRGVPYHTRQYCCSALLVSSCLFVPCFIFPNHFFPTLSCLAVSKLSKHTSCRKLGNSRVEAVSLTPTGIVCSVCGQQAPSSLRCSCAMLVCSRATQLRRRARLMAVTEQFHIGLLYVSDRKKLSLPIWQFMRVRDFQHLS